MIFERLKISATQTRSIITSAVDGLSWDAFSLAFKFYNSLNRQWILSWVIREDFFLFITPYVWSINNTLPLITFPTNYSAKDRLGCRRGPGLSHEYKVDITSGEIQGVYNTPDEMRKHM